MGSSAGGQVIGRGIRLSVEGGDVVVRELAAVGAAGERELARVGKGAQAASANLEKTGAAAEGMSRATGGAIGNIANQFQDVIVQAQSGTAALTIFIQQGTQIASAFGPIGAVIGVAGAAIGLAAKAIFGFGEQTDFAKQQQELFSSVLADTNDQLEAQIDKINRASDETRKYLGVLAQATLSQKQGEAAPLITELANIGSSKDRPGGFWDFGGLANLGGEIKAAQDVKGRLVAAVNSGGGAAEVFRVADELGLTGEATVQSLGELADLANDIAAQKALVEATTGPNSFTLPPPPRPNRTETTGERRTRVAGERQADRVGDTLAEMQRENAALEEQIRIYQESGAVLSDKAKAEEALAVKLAEVRGATDGQNRAAQLDLDLKGQQAQQLVDLATTHEVLTERVKNLAGAGREQERVEKELETLRKRYLSPTEQLVEKETELARLRDTGSIDQLAYERELAAARRDAADQTKRLADEELKRRRDPAAGAQRALAEITEATTNQAQLVEDALTGAFRNSEDVLVDSVANMKLSFEDLGEAAEDFTRQIIADLARIAIRTAITGPLFQAIAGGAASFFGGPAISGGTGTDVMTGGGVGGDLLANAYGNAFDLGRVIPLAKGGVVDRPIVFPMARGMGLMGEAGPEVVAPLRRNAQGRMGVDAVAPVIHFQVVNEVSGVQVEQRQESGPGGEVMLRAYVRKALAAEIAGGHADKALRGRFGLSPSPVGRS